MSWESFFLICFIVGLVLSFVSMFGGFAHLHLHLGSHVGHVHGLHMARGSHGGHAFSAINGFTVTAFLCWFGGAGYLLERYTGWIVPLILLGACFSGVFGAAILWAALFKFLVPHERLLTTEETEMAGMFRKAGPNEAIIVYGFRGRASSRAAAPSSSPSSKTAASSRSS
jgi:hypothetical protein